MSNVETPISLGQVINEIHSTHQEIDILTTHIDSLVDRLLPILGPSKPADDEKAPPTLVPMAMNIQEIKLRLNKVSMCLKDLLARIEL